MPRPRPVIALTLLGVVSGAFLAAGQPTIQSESDFAAFSSRYYVEPHPELVGAAIDYLGASGILKKGAAVPPAVAFFVEVFARNPARVAEWTAVIERQPDEVRTALRRAVALSSNPKTLLDGEPPSPRRNDICWGAFFGSGDGAYLTRLMDELRHMNERDDLNLFMTAASAKWSLASNARSHPVVRAAVKTAREAATGPLAVQLDDVLSKAPGQIQQEMISVYREQHQKGIW